MQHRGSLVDSSLRQQHTVGLVKTTEQSLFLSFLLPLFFPLYCREAITHTSCTPVFIRDRHKNPVQTSTKSENKFPFFTKKF
tara:strand:- start:1645 stop:1890 length:246 start_codon:yes stop_codon:yes gene_type:complete